jgi:TolA-binding protein
VTRYGEDSASDFQQYLVTKMNLYKERCEHLEIQLQELNDRIAALRSRLEDVQRDNDMMRRGISNAWRTSDQQEKPQ